MERLSLDRINYISPYKIWEEDGTYLFLTTQGVLYGISFSEEFDFAGVMSYQLSLARLNDVHGYMDHNIRQVVKAIVTGFFDANKSIMIYLCDTSDGKEIARNRLFLQWLNDEDFSKRFIYRTAQANVEGQGIYTAIIVERDHPLLSNILEDFELSAQTLAK